MSLPKKAKFSLFAKKGFTPVNRDQAKPFKKPEEALVSFTDQVLETVEPYSEPKTVTLDELKLEAKKLKIKGWNFYKDPIKLNQKIDEVREALDQTNNGPVFHHPGKGVAK